MSVGCCVCLILSSLLLCSLASASPVSATDRPAFALTDLYQILENLSVDEKLGGLDTLAEQAPGQVCLVSNSDEVELVVAGCIVSHTSIVFVSPAGQCALGDLSLLTSRVLSGSVESECHFASSDLALTKIDRSGQHHIVFNFASRGN